MINNNNNNDNNAVLNTVSNKSLCTFLKETDHVAFIKDRAGLFVYTNSRFNTLHPMCSGEVNGKRTTDVLPNGVAQSIVLQEANVRNSGNMAESTISIPNTTGVEEQWHLLTFTVPALDQKVLIGGLCVKLDNKHDVQKTKRELISKLGEAAVR